MAMLCGEMIFPPLLGRPFDGRALRIRRIARLDTVVYLIYDTIGNIVVIAGATLFFLAVDRDRLHRNLQHFGITEFFVHTTPLYKLICAAFAAKLLYCMPQNLFLEEKKHVEYARRR